MWAPGKAGTRLPRIAYFPARTVILRSPEQSTEISCHKLGLGLISHDAASQQVVTPHCTVYIKRIAEIEVIQRSYLVIKRK